MNQKTLRQIHQYFSELCEFKENFLIDGNYKFLEKTNSKEACALKAQEHVDEYPDAIGVLWDEGGRDCYKEFEKWTITTTKPYGSGKGWFGCSFGISYCIYLPILPL